MSAHTEARLPAYLERQLSAQLEKLNVAADSEEGQEAREKMAERHRNKLKAARLRRAAKKAAVGDTLVAETAEHEEDMGEKKAEEGDPTPTSASETLSPTKKQRRLKGSPASPEAPEDSSEPTKEPVAPKTSRKRGARSAKASSPDTSSSIA